MTKNAGYKKALGWLGFIICLSFSAASKAVITTANIAPCGDVVAFKGLAYFCADHPIYGEEVHVSNGGKFSTKLVHDLDPGPGNSSPFGFFEYKGFLYFIAETTTTGWSLWRTDGSSGEMTLMAPRIATLTELLAGGFGLDPEFQIVGEAGGSIYIQAGEILLKTDGSRDGTVKVKVPISTGSFSSLSAHYPTSYAISQDRLFVMTSGVLYRISSDGNSRTIARFPLSDIHPYIYKGTDLAGQFFISAINYNRDSSTYFQPQLWTSDGTFSGTSQLRNDGTELLGRVRSELILGDYFGEKLISTKDGVNDNFTLSLPVGRGDEIVDLKPITIGDNLVFNVGNRDVRDSLWITNGSSSGTKKIGNGSLFSFRPAFYAERLIGNIDVFSAPVAKIVSIDRRGNINQIANGTVYAASSIGVYFRSGDDLWLTTGTTSGSRLIKRGVLKGTSFSGIEGQRMFFKKNASNALWHSDGTGAGTYALNFRYEDGQPQQETQPIKAFITAIIDLLIDDAPSN